MRSWLALAVVASLGCGRFGFAPTADDDDAPPGDGAGDGASADGAPVPPCLGTTHLLIDNFDDNMRDTAVWGNAYQETMTYHQEKDGHVEIVLSATSSTDWAGYVTSTTYVLEDDRIFVEVVRAPVANAVTAFHAAGNLGPAQDGASIEVEGANVIARKRVASEIFDQKTVTYDATLHRWWQLRERDNTLYWELSPDAVQWTVLHTEPTPFDVTAVYMTMAAGSRMTGGSPGSAIYDNFNGGGAPQGCP